MNYRLLAKVFGSILMLLAAAQGVCLAYAVVLQLGGVEHSGLQGLLPSAIVTGLCAGALLWLGRGSPREILRKEAAVIVGLGWVVSALFGSLPYLFGEPQLSFDFAFFESMSGFTTTGSTIVADLEVPEWSKPLLLWRALTQWLGGLGILVLFVALLAYLGVGDKTIFSHESSLRSGGEATVTRISSGARLFALTYVGWTAFAVLGLWLLRGTSAVPLGWFEAIVHALAAVSTGGFSPYNASVGAFESTPIELLLILVMLGCSINILFYPALFRRRWHRVLREEEGLGLVLIVIVSTILVVFNLTWQSHAYAAVDEAFLDALFNVVSVMTTTGFGSNWRQMQELPQGFNHWPGFSVAMLLVLMVIGGSSGSTSGGVKVVRVMLLLKLARQEIVRSFRPQRVFSLSINRTHVGEGAARQAVVQICLFLLCLAIGTLLLSLLEPGYDFLTCTSASAATLFNIGPGLEAVGPTENYSHFSAASLFLMTVLMALGRLELFAVLALFVPSLWRKY